jgi:hypothetical protein
MTNTERGWARSSGRSCWLQDEELIAKDPWAAASPAPNAEW